MKLKLRVLSVKMLALIIGLSIVAVTSGCHPAGTAAGPVRAIWVTRYDYKTSDDVVRIIDDCADAGFNAVLFQVRGKGTAFYKSSFEPWADELGGRDPGFDPLALACARAHARNVQLHAYVNVMPAWRGTKPPTNPEQLYNKRPEWFWYDQKGERQKLSSFYVSLNPCWPEVRRYLVDVFHEIVARYDVDGLHLDYIRFPNEPPAIPRGSGIDYPHDERTVELFHKDTGLKPSADKAAWDKWRSAQVTKLVAEIHDMVQRTKPKVIVSAAVGSVPERALHHFQDSRRWITDGIIDMVFLMNYTRGDPNTFGNRLKAWEQFTDQTVLVPGLWFFAGLPVAEGCAQVRHEIEVARRATGHFCVFAYASMFDASRGRSQEQTETQRKQQQRREALIPFLRSLDQKR